MSPINRGPQKPRSTPKCVRCRNHGIDYDKKGHKKDCEWKDCNCDKCILLIERKNVESMIKNEELKEKRETQTQRLRIGIHEKQISHKNTNKSFKLSRKINPDNLRDLNTNYDPFNEHGDLFRYQSLQRVYTPITPNNNSDIIHKIDEPMNESQQYKHTIDEIMDSSSPMGTTTVQQTNKQFDDFPLYSGLKLYSQIRWTAAIEGRPIKGNFEGLKQNREHTLLEQHLPNGCRQIMYQLTMGHQALSV